MMMSTKYATSHYVVRPTHSPGWFLGRKFSLHAQLSFCEFSKF